ncbi:HD domain-containing protein [Draconibacterium sp. IB214405]|uniref:HD domain-containing protein n=1 Tax=Draconibacterium sp. IB214405 TaxID=3097352 RepID=UPI002A0CA09A|nr:HD domain-containing protein [Draconibacterium sp. IB214405]MDX8341742.1 HD domain-containing protein [Draconibacterium sp. IB214405]
MQFEKELDKIINDRSKENLKNFLNSYLLKAYNLGWNMSLWGDDAPALDAATDNEILKKIKEEPLHTESKNKWEHVDVMSNKSLPKELQEAYQKAIRFAGEKHKDQKIPSSEINYMVHVSNVAMEILMAYQAEPYFDVVYAVQVALLHDVLEDTDTGYNELKTAFGERITNAVLALSKNKNIQDKSERMKDSLKRILQLEKEVGMVKLADRITNLQPPPKHWTKEKVIMYSEEAQIIYMHLNLTNKYLAHRLKTKVAQYRRYLE